MIWKKWDLWNFVLRHVARSQGFLDPVTVFSRLQRFSKPSEVWVPTELLRSGAILQARGLMNSQAIQHNLDWIWPHWVNRQFDPTDVAFIPRSFSMTHINLTHRNWTAVGIPDFDELPIVDPRGLVTPFYDGWSIDAWILREDKKHLILARLLECNQKISWNENLEVTSSFDNKSSAITSRTEVVLENGVPVCRIHFNASSDAKASLVVAVRPYNPEGISFINEIQQLPGREGWKIGGKREVYFDRPVSRYIFSNYFLGDVFSRIHAPADNLKEIKCDVGMATAAAVYEIQAGVPGEVTVRIPLLPDSKASAPASEKKYGSWKESLGNYCRLEIPEKDFEFLYESAIRTLVLHSPGDVYPGPFTYKRFWFRDAAFILQAMLCVGMTSRVEKVLDRFPSRQVPGGHFLSQDGEWDSNGQALWILERFCLLTGQKPKEAWRASIRRGGLWIKKKRLSSEKNAPHAGLLPAGFSAEHLGPNDFYYWDDFWGVAGLRSASRMMRDWEPHTALELEEDAKDFMISIEKSLTLVQKRLGHQAMPASPYRRMDAGAIGSVAAGYPLQLWKASDARLLATAHHILDHCFINGGFYQEISHSGVNAYLTLEVAQLLLRAGDAKYLDPVRAIAAAATSTGQWPEAIHPRTQGGCMGDGQHVWAAAEWVLMMRNLFLREEEDENILVLCPGIIPGWLQKGNHLFYGPAATAFGTVSVEITVEDSVKISWDARWHQSAPALEIHLIGRPKIKVPAGQTVFEMPGGRQ